ncbi:MAG: hypothetical protein M1358_00630 [Chloroflexi bacterium]|nr:hypothetical protein [Chloroflexota bacterium]
MKIDPKAALRRARMGALALHAKYDSKETTAKARATFMAKFVDEVDPDRKLPEAERLRRAEYAKKLYFARMAAESAKSRKRKRR